MKKLYTTLHFAALACIVIYPSLCFSATDVPAFPGAEGHGRYTTGGRGGEVRHVTTLDDGTIDSPGTLRWAVNGDEKKTVVFDVGGIIALNSDLSIGANTSILGQTAPSPGITIRYYTVKPDADNIIIRFVRFRRGQELDVNDGADCIWTRHRTGMIIDHCSMSWCIDELASFYDNNNFTMQWCTLGEALANAGHDKGAHSYGGIWGGKLASFHHNFLISFTNRMPRFNGARYYWEGYTDNKEYSKYGWTTPAQAEIVDFRNCVMYNWGTGTACYGGPGGGQINIVNNYYKAGPATKHKTTVTKVSIQTAGSDYLNEVVGMSSRYYISGNHMTAATSPENYDWNGVEYDGGHWIIDDEVWTTDPLNQYDNTVLHKNNSNGDACVRVKMESPTATGDVTTHSATTAFDKVTAYSGASLFRDAVDLRYANEAKTGTATYVGSNTPAEEQRPGIIDVVSDQGDYTLAETKREADFDTDADGIPDTWETLYGLDPNDPTDGNAYTLDTEKKFYTNLEVYANCLVEEIMKNGNKDAQTSVNEYYPSLSTTKTNIVKGKDYDTTIYNLQGQEVTKRYKGVVVKGEKLQINKS